MSSDSTLLWGEGFEIELVWVSNFYDHPLSGMARKDGQDYWFTWKDHEDLTGAVLTLWTLHPDDEADQRHRHAQFEEHVSTSWCYHLPPEERIVRPQEEHATFYDRYLDPPQDWPGILARAESAATYAIIYDSYEEE